MEFELGELLQDSDDKIKSQFHTLFIKEASDTIQKKLTEEEAAAVGVDEVTIECKPHKEYTLYTSAYVSETNDMAETMNALRQSENPADTLEIFIDSPGGYVSEYIKLMTTAKGLFAGKTTTVLDPEGSSCGALLFCAGDIRVIPEFGHLMFHNYSGGARGKGQEIVAEVSFSDPHMNSLFRRIVVDSGIFNEDEFYKLTHGEDYYFDAYEACVRGAATHVIVGQYMVDAEDFVNMKDEGFTTPEEYAEYMGELADEEMKERFGDHINENGEIEITPELLEELGIEYEQEEE